MSWRSPERRNARIQRPVLYLLTGLALGPLYAWSIVSAAWSMPSTRNMAINVFTREPWKHAVSFALACAVMAWLLRKRIASTTLLAAACLALVCSLLGGPVYLFVDDVRSLILVPSQLEDMRDMRDWLMIPWTSLLFGGLFGFYFLPVTVPLTFAAILVLRFVSGGLKQQARIAQPSV